MINHESEFGGNQGYKTRLKGGYFPVPPNDQMADLRDEIVSVLEDTGLQVERAHHEVGAPGQAEINYRFSTLTLAADDLMKFKYVVKNTADAFGKSATFMPKPIFGDNGSGMHTHQSLWKDGEPLFYDEQGYGGLSDIARWYIGGLLKHAPSLLAFTNPTVNSYHRLVPGYEAPVNLVAGGRRPAIDDEALAPGGELEGERPGVALARQRGRRCEAGVRDDRRRSADRVRRRGSRAQIRDCSSRGRRHRNRARPWQSARRRLRASHRRR